MVPAFWRKVLSAFSGRQIILHAVVSELHCDGLGCQLFCPEVAAPHKPRRNFSKDSNLGTYPYEILESHKLYTGLSLFL